MPNLPYNPKLKTRARNLRKAGNLAEVLLWNQLKRKQLLGLDFDRQRVIGNYIVDFYCPSLMLVIEVDGNSHNDKVEYDAERESYLLSLGLKTMHFTDLDVKSNLDGVIEFIKTEVSNYPSHIQREKATTPSV
jgi:very-short-patch-repair endonuclease